MLPDRFLVMRTIVLFVVIFYSIGLVVLIAPTDPNLLDFLGINPSVPTRVWMIIVGISAGWAWYFIAGMMGARKLRRQEAQFRATAQEAPAIVQQVHDLRTDYQGGLLLGLRVRVKVMPDNDAPFETEVDGRFSRVALPRPGDGVTVIYDPLDHEKIKLV